MMKFEKATKILENEMTDKDFWFVTPCVDNFNILQDVLDLIFNCIEGQNYTAQYMSQSTNTRLVVHCGVCRKDLSSFDPFMTHDGGKPHKKTVRMLLDKKKENVDDVIVFKDPLEPLLIFESGTFEDKVDHLKIPVVGMQFVYKEKRDDVLYFTCELCMRRNSSFRISEDEMLHHVTSNYHITRFMDVVHGKREYNFKTLLPHVERVVITKGRLTHNIVEFEFDNYCRRFPSQAMGRKRTLSPPPLGIMPLMKIEPYSSTSIKREPGVDETPLGASYPPERVKTSDFGCQVEIPTRDMKDFINELRICVKEQEAITSVLRDATQNDRNVLTNTVKVFSDAVKKFYDKSEDKVMNKLVREFNEFTSIL